MGVENTSARDPLLHAVGMLGDGSDRYITDMEAAGQRQLVHSDRIPAEGPVDALIALGFTVGDPDPADPLFRPATLPEGWTRAATDYPMHSDILDVNGRPRVSIFYKAAFYDRRAHCNIVTPAAYVSRLIWSDGPVPDPIVDEWTTREALVEEIAKAKAVELESARHRQGFTREGAAEARARAARCDALLEILGGAE